MKYLTSKQTPPKILTDNGLSLLVDTIKLRELDLPIIEIDITDLLWVFEMPVWAKDGTYDWNLTPWEVIKKEDMTNDHQMRVNEADTSFPLVVTKYNNKYTVLDGVHRLVKLYLNGDKKIKVKMIPVEYLTMEEFQS